MRVGHRHYYWRPPRPKMNVEEFAASLSMGPAPPPIQTIVDAPPMRTAHAKKEPLHQNPLVTEARKTVWKHPQQHESEQQGKDLTGSAPLNRRPLVATT